MSRPLPRARATQTSKHGSFAEESSLILPLPRSTDTLPRSLQYSRARRRTHRRAPKLTPHALTQPRNCCHRWHAVHRTIYEHCAGNSISSHLIAHTLITAPPQVRWSTALQGPQSLANVKSLRDLVPRLRYEGHRTKRTCRHDHMGAPAPGVHTR